MKRKIHIFPPSSFRARPGILTSNHKRSQIATPILRCLLKIHGVNSIQLRSSYQTYKLSVNRSPREYISVFAVRANIIAFGNFCGRTFWLLRILTPGISNSTLLCRTGRAPPCKNYFDLPESPKSKQKFISVINN